MINYFDFPEYWGLTSKNWPDEVSSISWNSAIRLFAESVPAIFSPKQIRKAGKPMGFVGLSASMLFNSSFESWKKASAFQKSERIHLLKKILRRPIHFEQTKN